MPESFRAFTSDFSVAVRLQMKMDLPTNRDTVLSLFDRVRRDRPEMNRFKRFENELSLEGGGENGDTAHRWIGVRKTSIRIGEVNPPTLDDALALHRLVLTVAPNYLSISPLDIDYLELSYGFDLPSAGNHDAIVADALIGNGPLASLLNIKGSIPTSFQPVFGVSLNEEGDVQAQFEVKTRPTRAGKEADPTAAPITVICAVRKYGVLNDASELPGSLRTIAGHGEALIAQRVVPYLLKPIHEVISANNL